MVSCCILSYPTTPHIMQHVSNITYHHIIPYHIIAYHIISYHIISYHIISYHIISYHIISYHIISYHITSHHITSYHIMSYTILSYPILSYPTAPCIISYIMFHISHITYHTISYDMISNQIKSTQIISYHIISTQPPTYAHRQSLKTEAYHILCCGPPSRRQPHFSLIARGTKACLRDPRASPGEIFLFLNLLNLPASYTAWYWGMGGALAWYIRLFELYTMIIQERLTWHSICIDA